MEYENKNSHRGKGRGRGRGRKKNAENECKTQEIIPNLEERNESEPVTLDMDADITQLEAPTFSTINKGPPEPMLRLKWDHKTHLIGEKVINPMIHCCDKCDLPISIYGRMIPCKHVFCLLCAERENKVCPRCQEKVVRIEKTGLGTVFMCTFGGTRYGNTGCRRTYLSQRDLQAHINHRHVSNTAPMKENMNTQVLSLIKTSVPSSNRPKIMPPTHHAVAGDPRIQNATNEYYHKMHSPSSHSTSSSQHQSHSGSRQPQQFHHHSSNGNHHHERTQHSSQSHSVNQHSAQLQSTPHHLSMSNSQSVLQPPEFPSSLMVPNYPPPSTGTVTSTNLRSNLITVQIHDSNPDSVNSSMGIPMAAGFSHQTFSSQFTQNSSTSMTTFPVPPPNQLPTIGQISQSHPQFFSGSPANYTTTPPQRSLNNFNSNQTSSLISQPMMSNRTPPIVPPPRRPQFSGEPVMQPFPVPPPHRWHPPPNQTHFY